MLLKLSYDHSIKWDILKESEPHFLYKLFKEIPKNSFFLMLVMKDILWFINVNHWFSKGVHQLLVFYMMYEVFSIHIWIMIPTMLIV